MKNSNLLLLAAVGAGLYAISNNSVSSNDSGTSAPVGSSGLTKGNYTDAVQNDTWLGLQNAQAILNAPDAATALKIGDAVLSSSSPNPAYVAGQNITNAWEAVTAVKSVSSFKDNANPFTIQNWTSHSFPQTIGGIYVSDANAAERLSIAWDNAHEGFNS